MAPSNNERLARGLDIFRTGLAPYAERELQQAFDHGRIQYQQVVGFLDDRLYANKAISEWDVAGLISVMIGTWDTVFRTTLGAAERSYLHEIRIARNRWAHQEPCSSDDTMRYLDSMERVLTSISAPAQANEINRHRQELMRTVFAEQARTASRRSNANIESSGSLPAWRDVVAPHPDVASGRYQQAEFAADLWQVHLGEGSDEYRDPVEFFRRTYLTTSLRQLLTNAVHRIRGNSGDPVIQLQTNFGGGKTHSMLALYHLFGGSQLGQLAGVDELMSQINVTSVPAVRRVVLVGNKISPGNPMVKPDGTRVHTLWGEIAYQLGGAKAYASIQADDERATNPGDRLRQLFVEYGPCLILIDEWVAYARQLHDDGRLPAGTFDTQFTFAQSLTEAAKLAPACLLVISLPASDTAVADDIEVGGIRGRDALDRLRNVVGRLDNVWRPANAEEGFEIVRRRLFNPLTGDQYRQRDMIARAFVDWYRAHTNEFPRECIEADYEERIKKAFPIHPEVFDRLYNDWSTLAKFQRTRGVLRLMAAVIHCLWDDGDKNPLILPSTIPIDDPRVQYELTRYLPDQWAPIIERDVDGAQSLPRKIDNDRPQLGRLQATRRIARTVYIGSAPSTQGVQRGIEDQRVLLGSVMPSEVPAHFRDALGHLSSQATYFYRDNGRSWYDTQPTVTKTADDRAATFLRDIEQVMLKIEGLLREQTRNTGDFSRIHVAPATGADIPDDMDTRLVILRPDQPYSRDAHNRAQHSVESMLQMRGNAPREFRNTLVFLAADAVRLPDLTRAVALWMAWQSILNDKTQLNLTPQQVNQAEKRLGESTQDMVARLNEVYQILLVPYQLKTSPTIEWQMISLKGGDGLAVRVSQRLRKDELLVAEIAPTIVRRYMDEVPLWRGDAVRVSDMVNYFAQYLYLPRLTNHAVLMNALNIGSTFKNPHESFGVADAWDDQAKRFIGLRTTSPEQFAPTSKALLVKPDVALAQLAQPVAPSVIPPINPPPITPPPIDPPPVVPPITPPATKTYRRYFGSVELDASRAGKHINDVINEIVEHMVRHPGATVRLKLDIEADFVDGATDHVRRTVNENSPALRVQGRFEER